MFNCADAYGASEAGKEGGSGSMEEDMNGNSIVSPFRGIT